MNMNLHPNAKVIVNMMLDFLKLFLCETLAKRLVSLLLLTAGIPNCEITELTGLCDRSVRTLRTALDTGETEGLFTVNGGGRKSKTIQFEQEIINEINSNDYNSRRQIADMIHRKFGVKISVSAVGKLLKKTESES